LTPAATLPLWLALGVAVPRPMAAAPSPDRLVAPARTAPSRPAVTASPSGATSAALQPIRRVDTRQPEVALTFDACATKKGWYGFDRDIFAILKSQRVPATIFVSGLWVETHPEAMADLMGDPLIEFGDHSYDHPHMTRLAPARVDEEIDATEAALSRYGRHAVAFRPPFGEWNPRLLELVRQRQLPTVTWDVVSGDPSARATAAGIVHTVLGQARPGSIIIFHINGRGWKTHEALPDILAGLRQRGFKFVGMSELLQGDPAAQVAAPRTVAAGPSLPPGR
jgi:peptidoglycan/xylan/chitin deacetylase (PgdA/CDA1 family)